jgi:electron transfer flavoprotein alpha subunit
MTVLVVASHDNHTLARATLHTVSAAQKTGGNIHILVAGYGCASVAHEAAQIAGVEKILLADDPAYAHQLAENMALLVAGTAEGYSHILVAATSAGKDFLPRAAALLDVAQISEIITVVSADSFRRPIYAGNAIETVQSKDGIKLLTVRQTAFDAAISTGGNANIEAISGKGNSGLSEFISQDESKPDRVDLEGARVVVSGGRGMGSKENFILIEDLAKKLGAAIGASRAAVDAGYIANDAQVGQTGKIVAPELYIAVGISGAIQHLAGMKDSRIIVAVNKDENAPIFEIADYALVADLFEALPELIRRI